MRADAGHEGREGADDGDEAGDDDRLAAVLLVELVGALEVLRVQELDVPLEGPRPDLVPDPVVDGVAGDGGAGEEQEQDADLERRRGQGGQGARREEQRVAGEERRHHQPRLAEDDEGEDRVCPHPVLLDELPEVRVEVKEEVDDLGDEFHG